MKQVGLIPSGCQLRRNQNSIYFTDRYAFYTSAVALYALNTSNFYVEKVLKASETHIACFTVSPHNNNLLVTVSDDGQIMLWDVEEVMTFFNDWCMYV